MSDLYHNFSGIRSDHAVADREQGQREGPGAHGRRGCAATGRPGSNNSYRFTAGETLYRIAKRYNTEIPVLRGLNTLAESDFVFEGQALFVPRLDDTRVSSYQVESGDTLFRIARRIGTSVSTLRSLNGIGVDGRILAGQTLLLPITSGGRPRSEFAFGLTLYADQSGVDEATGQVARLGVNWVKLEVSWASIEPEQDQFEFAALDETIAALNALGVGILLNTL